MTAGAVLVGACKGNRPERFWLVYPILFNYRHGIELAMKWLIGRYASYSSVQVGKTTHHDLWRLWMTCKPIIIEVGSNDDAIPIVEQVVKDFHDLDRSSFAFRYAKDKKDALIPLPDGMLDLENLRDVMEAVEHFFEGADAQMDHHASAAEWSS